jgi:hypothetical protein
VVVGSQRSGDTDQTMSVTLINLMIAVIAAGFIFGAAWQTDK